MIAKSMLEPVATVVKTHGIHGELNCTLFVDYDILEQLPCLFVELDGLWVPFKVKSLRRRGPESVLLTFYDSLVGHDIMARCSDLPDDDRGDDVEDGFYLSDIIGFEVETDGKPIGVLDDFDDSTANLLMFVSTPAGKIVRIPAADEFFVEVDTDSKIIRLDLPEGLLELNN